MKKKWFIISSLFLFTWLVNNLISAETMDVVFRRQFFQYVRLLYEKTLWFLPFPFIYLVMITSMCVLFFVLKFICMERKNKPVIELLQPLAFYIAVLYFLFYGLWGFNYRALGLTSKLALKDVTLDTMDVIRELGFVNDQLELIRNEIWKDTSAIPFVKRPNDIAHIIRASMQEVMFDWGLQSNRKFHIRALYPKGSLLMFSTAGIYIPYALEGHYDPGLFHLHSGFVIAHEMGHGYGITSEAECNFIALLTCLNAEDKYLQYSGLLTYWRYLMHDLRDKAPFSFYRLAFHRPLGLRNDLKALYAALDQYPEVMPAVRDLIYDSYLKANGIPEGLQSYNRILELMQSWKKSGWNQDIKKRLYRE
ncbi:MAG: DUF3810 family protein [Saprospiraceae bacterium]|nr:DUF3810 family protein [Saprospiraceae bacterium]